MYYAAFYAAKALLATRELDAARHSGAIALFQLHFVKPGVIRPDVARILPQVFQSRQRTDYADYLHASRDDVDELRPLVESFVEACRAVLKDAPPDSR